MQLFRISNVYIGIIENVFKRNTIAAIFGVFLTVLLVHTSAFADTLSATSSNWSGYVAQNGIYTGVSGTWTIPTITPSSTLTSNATWVGIGGRTTSDLIQAGIYEIANSDGVTYQAWYELLPADSIPVNLSVKPGDSISIAIIETSQNTWNIVITNNTLNQQVEKTVTYQSSLSSAEWIQERPLVNGAFAMLSGFTPVTFNGATAVQNGTRISLAQTGATLTNLVDTGSNVALAVPSSVGTDGMSFGVDRTSATAGQVPTPQQSFTPPFEMHRTGRISIPWIVPSVSWSIHFPHQYQ